MSHTIVGRGGSNREIRGAVEISLIIENLLAKIAAGISLPEWLERWHLELHGGGPASAQGKTNLYAQRMPNVFGVNR